MTSSSPRPVAERLAPSGVPVGDTAFTALTAAAALAVIGLLAALVLRLGVASVPTWTGDAAGFLLGIEWNPDLQVFGALPYVVATIVTGALAMVIAVPAGLLAAIFLVEIAPPRLATPLGILIDLIAALPSVVIGLWGLYVLVPLVRALEAPVVERLGAGGGPFKGPATGLDVLSAALILAVMVTPTIVSIGRAVIATLPVSTREAYVGLGATRWETIRHVVLPPLRGGLLGACLIALGRALGETMAVIFVIGNADKVPTGLFDQARTIAGRIASAITESSGQAETSALLALAMVLMVISLVVSLAARLLVRRSVVAA